MVRHRGRPVSVGRAAVFSMRLRPDLRQKLDEAAEAEGTSLTDQIERRLAQSFEDGAQATQDRAVLRVLAEIMRRLDAATGRRWADDPWLFAQFQHAVAYALDQWCPDGVPTKPTALPRRTPEDIDQLGRYTADGVLLQMDFAEGADPFARLKRDLGDLAQRGGAA